MENNLVAILGGGNGGHALAAEPSLSFLSTHNLRFLIMVVRNDLVYLPEMGLTFFETLVHGGLVYSFLKARFLAFGLSTTFPALINKTKNTKIVIWLSRIVLS